MISCSCKRITRDAFNEAADKHAEQIRAAKTFARAVGIVVRATHDGEPEQNGRLSDRCGGCFNFVGQVIVEKGLRPVAEYAEYEKWWMETRCKDCGKGCKVPDFLNPATT